MLAATRAGIKQLSDERAGQDLNELLQPCLLLAYATHL